MVAAVFQESLHAISLPEFAASCDTCPELTQPRGQRQTGWPKCRKNVTPELAPYFNVRDELVVDDSFIMRGTDRLIVPVSLRPRVIDLAHEGHQGLVRTKQRLCELYWWPQMDNYVYNMTASCVSCQYTDKTTKTAPAPFLWTFQMDHGRKWGLTLQAFSTRLHGTVTMPQLLLIIIVSGLK